MVNRVNSILLECDKTKILGKSLIERLLELKARSEVKRIESLKLIFDNIKKE